MCVYVCVCVRMYVLCMYVCMYVCVCMCICMYICVYFYLFIYLLHVPLLAVILHALFHIYGYYTMLISIYNYCYILRWFGYINVISKFVKRNCVGKVNEWLIMFPY
jgi:hypothetical protein